MKGKTCPLHPTKWNHLLLTVLLKIPLNYLFWMGLLLALANRTYCCLNIKQFTARELFCFIRYFQIFTNIVKYWVDIDSLKKKKKKEIIHSFFFYYKSLQQKHHPLGEHANYIQIIISSPWASNCILLSTHSQSFYPKKKQKKTKQISLQKYVVFE